MNGQLLLAQSVVAIVFRKAAIFHLGLKRHRSNMKQTLFEFSFIFFAASFFFLFFKAAENSCSRSSCVNRVQWLGGWGCCIGASVSVPSVWVTAGWPSHGGDVTVYALDINQPSFHTLFLLLLCLFLFIDLSTVFHCINSLDNSLLSQSVLVLFCLIGPFDYTSLFESLPQPCYKHQPTN